MVSIQAFWIIKIVKLGYGNALDMFYFTELILSHIFFKFLDHIKKKH